MSFLTDFGTRDHFVGVCTAVVLDRAPHAHVVDLTHDITPGDVGAGALVLARAVPHLPVAVHLAVVDPGVGTDRRGIAVVARRGDVLVGPDNGLLVPAADALGGAVAVVALDDRAAPSATFHGRDVFAPAAGAAAAGADPRRFGPEVTAPVVLDAPRATRAEPGLLEAEVVLVDRFGNVQLAAGRAHLEAAAFAAGTSVAVSAGDVREHATIARAFGDVAPQALLVHIDSDEAVAVAVNGASAAERLAVSRGDVVTIASGG